MPKPKTKQELLIANEADYNELRLLVADFSDTNRNTEFPFVHRDRNLRDVFAHLFEWQSMMLNWYKSGMAGETPVMPAPGFTWRETPALNAVIWEKHQASQLEKIMNQLDKTHRRLTDLIKSHSNRELFTKKHYAWTGSTSLGSYLTSAMSSHYKWATKLVKRFARENQNQ